MHPNLDGLRIGAAMPTHKAQFDTLRALAILSVVADHFGSGVAHFPIPTVIHLGSLGVRFFFVLSGYFITLSLLRARSKIDGGQTRPLQSLGGFYLRRFLRIGPPYILFIVIGLALGLGTMRSQIPWLASFTVNFFIAARNQWPEVTSHLWSICVQEQFYLVWPALILFAPYRMIVPTLLALAVGCLLFRIGCVSFGVPPVVRWMLPWGSLDAFAAGAIVAVCYERFAVAFSRLGAKGRSILGVACPLVLVGVMVLRNHSQQSIALVAAEFLEAIALAYFVFRTGVGFDGSVGRFLSQPFLVRLGTFSYGIYVYHVLVAVCFDTWMPGALRWLIKVPLCRLLVLSLTTVLLAQLSWRLIETPLASLRRRA